MVDVGNLEPGNYVVGISDPSVIGQQPVPGAVPTANRAATAAGRRRRRNATDPATQPGTTIPPTGQVRPSTIPPTGQVNPSSATPTGQSAANIALTEQINQANAAKTGAGGRAGVQCSMRLARSLSTKVGRAGCSTLWMACRSATWSARRSSSIRKHPRQQKTLPPNLDPTADPAAGQAPGQGGAAQPASPGLADSRGRNCVHRTCLPMPVAAGIIRLISDHRPAPVAQPPSNASAAPPATVR